MHDSTSGRENKPNRLQGILHGPLAPLCTQKIWLCWRKVKRVSKTGTRFAKEPYQPDGARADVSDWSTWGSYETCLSAVEAAQAGTGPPFDGIGFVVRDSIVAVDVDNAMPPGDIGACDTWCGSLIPHCSSYTEITPSGQGFRIIGLYHGPKFPRESIPAPNGTAKVEIYFQATRFVTVTNDIWPGTEECILRDLTDVLPGIYRELDSNDPKKDKPRHTEGPGMRKRGQPGEKDRADLRFQELIETGDWTDKEGRVHRFEDERSENLFVFCLMAAGRGWSDAEMIAVLLDPAKRFHEHFLDQGGNPHEKAMRQIRRGRDKVETEREAERERGSDFICHGPSGHFYCLSTGTPWTSEKSLNAALGFIDGVKASEWLRANALCHEMTWAPRFPTLIEGETYGRHGFMKTPGARTYNRFIRFDPPSEPGDVAPYLAHGATVYPTGFKRILQYAAFVLRNPGIKPNFALILGGVPNAGKDTILKPLRHAIGEGNWKDVEPHDVMGNNNEWAMAQMVLINETRDTSAGGNKGDYFKFYEKLKNLITTPPPSLRINIKHEPQFMVPKSFGVILTTNHRIDALPLEPNDRRFEVFWTDFVIEDVEERRAYFNPLYAWLNQDADANGIGLGSRRVIHHLLHAVDLTDFDPNEAPQKTDAFWAMASHGDSPEGMGLDDAVTFLKTPVALTIDSLVLALKAVGESSLCEWLQDRMNARTLNHRLDEAGYRRFMNPKEKRGRWKIEGRQRVVYGHHRASPERITAAIDRLPRVCSMDDGKVYHIREWQMDDSKGRDDQIEMELDS